MIIIFYSLNCLFKKNNTVLLILVGLILFSSCNSSLSVLNRKYRKGYTVNLYKRIDNEAIQLNVREQFSDSSSSSSLIKKNNDDNSIASINNSELSIINYQTLSFVMPCDTPPKKNSEEPWSLYKPKEPLTHGSSKWKQIEPFNLASIFVLLLGVVIASILNPTGILFFLFFFTIIFVFSLISLVRIKKHPKQYSVFSKVFDWILVSIGSLWITILLIILLLFLASA